MRPPFCLVCNPCSLALDGFVVSFENIVVGCVKNPKKQKKVTTAQDDVFVGVLDEKRPKQVSYYGTASVESGIFHPRSVSPEAEGPAGKSPPDARRGRSPIQPKYASGDKGIFTSLAEIHLISASLT